MQDLLVELIGNFIIILIFFGPPALIIYLVVNHQKKVRLRKQEQKKYSHYKAYTAPKPPMPYPQTLSRAPSFQNNARNYTPVEPISSPNYMQEPSQEERKGTFGEYLLVKSLKEMPGEKRILTNCYIPKDDGTTTEIDIIMIHETGIYVIESKNYSGWIFGTDTDKNWTHTYPNGQKYQFYNPIMQNQNYVKHLRNLIGDDLFYFSFVVFGENCELKSISNNTKTAVCDENTFKGRLYATLTSLPKSLSTDKLKDVYIKLSEYEYATKEEKQTHIANITGEKSE